MRDESVEQLFKRDLAVVRREAEVEAEAHRPPHRSALQANRRVELANESRKVGGTHHVRRFGVIFGPEDK